MFRGGDGVDELLCLPSFSFDFTGNVRLVEAEADDEFIISELFFSFDLVARGLEAAEDGVDELRFALANVTDFVLVNVSTFSFWLLDDSSNESSSELILDVCIARLTGVGGAEVCLAREFLLALGESIDLGTTSPVNESVELFRSVFFFS